MESVQVEIKTDGPVSRLEVIIRLFWSMIVGFVLGIFGIVVGFLWVLNFFTCLLLKKRHGAVFVAAIVRQEARLNAYALFCTDERPPIIPEFD